MRAGGKQSGLKKNEKKNERQNIQEAICLAGWFATANEIYDLKKFSFFFKNQSKRECLAVCLAGEQLYPQSSTGTHKGRKA